MGFNVQTFHDILNKGFETEWNTQPIPRHDVLQTSSPIPTHRSLDAVGALGLALHFLTSTMTEISLMQIFALISSTVSRFINFSLAILLKTLRKMPDARIQWLQGDEFQESNDFILVCHPLLNGAFGSMDGLNLPVQTSADQEMENATFNGWLHEHFVSSVFAFSATGLTLSIFFEMWLSIIISYQVSSLQPNSMHREAGMMLMLLEISMRSCVQKLLMGIILYVTLLSPVVLIKFKVT